MEPVAPTEEDSPLARAAARVGDRWSLLIVQALLAGPLRFGELQTELPGIATNVLSERLRRLEREGVLVASAYSTRPPRYRYELTQTGRELGGVLRLLAQWGAGGAGGLEHGACGTPMEARWWCPTCERTVAEDEQAEPRFI
jgi:DNA-binding HxlR family transcriptional regulator